MHMPRLWVRVAGAAALAAAVSFTGVAAAPAAPLPGSATAPPSQVETLPETAAEQAYPASIREQILTEVNLYRVQNLRLPVLERVDVDAVAQSWANRLAFDQQLKANNSTKGEWHEIIVRFPATGLSATELVRGLHHSERDAVALLAGGVPRAGVGIAVSGGYTYLVVNLDPELIEDFGSAAASTGSLGVTTPQL